MVTCHLLPELIAVLKRFTGIFLLPPFLPPSLSSFFTSFTPSISLSLLLSFLFLISVSCLSSKGTGGINVQDIQPSWAVNSPPPILGVSALFILSLFLTWKGLFFKVDCFAMGQTLLCYVPEIQFDLPEMLSIGVINWNVFREGASSLKAPQQASSSYWHELVPEAHYLFGNQDYIATWLSSSSLITQGLHPVCRIRREPLPCEKCIFITNSHSTGMRNWIQKIVVMKDIPESKSCCFNHFITELY